MSPRESILDASKFPLVIFRLPSVVEVATVDTLEREQEQLFQRGRHFVSMVDLREVSAVPTATVRKRIGEWAKSIEGKSARYQLANALVVESTLIRAALSAVHWLAPPPVPTKVFATDAEAFAFLRSHLERAGIPSAYAGL